MPSSISKEDFRAHLYLNGIKDPRKLNEVMRLAEVYALSVHRRIEGQELPPDIPEAFSPIKPGEWNSTLEITCCVICEHVKRWDEFHVDRQHPSGHKTTCRSCRREDEGFIPGNANVRRGGWLCGKDHGGCGQRRSPDEFPPEKRDNPRKPLKCIYCTEN